MDETIITWNATNTITIWLMALVGAVLLGFLATMVKNRGAKTTTPNPA